MLSDLRFALRQLAKSPGFTVVALLTLALGIGVNTSMFSLVDVLLLKSAPFPEGDRLFQVMGSTRQGNRNNFSEVELREMHAVSSSFTSLTALNYNDSALVEAGRPAEQVTGVMASAEFFDTFRVQPMLGRAFTASETKPGNNQVIVLSHAFWQKRFGGSPDVIGRSLRIDSEPVTVIGVMPASFDWVFLWGSTAFWRPLNFTPDQIKERGYRAFQLIGRLPPGVAPRQIATEYSRVAAQQQTDFPKDYDGISYRAVVLHEAQMDDEGRQILWMLLGLSGFVLLIACANLANLQLARATSAVREFAIRAALGASRAALIRQQLTECVLLSVTGGGFGLLLALWMNQALSTAIRIGDNTGVLQMPLDGKVLLVTFSVAVLTGMIFGIVPAWMSSRTDVVTALKSQSRGSTSGRGHHRMRQALIIAEVTLALTMLGGAAVMQRGFAHFIHKEVGWDTGRLLTGALNLPEKRFTNEAARIAFYRQVEDRLATLPGVEKVALTTGVPIWGYGYNHQILTEKQASANTANLPQANVTMMTADFFKVLGVSLLEGRVFAPDTKFEDPKVVVINEALARAYWPGQSAVGQRLGVRYGETINWLEVVGVVRNTESPVEIGNASTPYQTFRPLTQEPWGWFRVALRCANPATLVDPMRKALAELDPDLPATDVTTVEQALKRQQHNLIVVSDLLTGFALLGLVLAAIGLYGVISNLVAQRTGEFGIRLALGATPGNILSLVLNHGLKLTLIGLGLGLGGAYSLSRLLNHIMPRLVSPDALALSGMAVVLFLVALLACWLPARRATKVDPMVALRAE